MSWPGAIDASRTALVLGDRRMSYGELSERAETLAGRLSAEGVRDGDVVAIMLGNTPDFFVAAWAAQMSGLYFVPISEKLTVKERAYIFEDSGTKLVLTAADIDEPRLRPSEWTGASNSFARVEGSDMLYTSGTTGRPKGVKRPLSGAELGSDPRRIDRARELFGMNEDTVFLSPAPLYHAAPLRYAMTVQRLGGTVVAMPKFDASEALRLLAAEAVTHSQWVPTMFSRLLALPNAEVRNVPPTHRCAIHAGAPCPEAVKRRMIDWWGPILHEYYSGTEAVGFTHITSEQWLARPNSVGQAYGSTIHILDENGDELPAGETGRVFFEGRAGLAYHNAPKKTASAMTAEGWATMGDIGHVDADGFLYLTDRAAFTIISGGVNIYPAEIENALMAYPDVVDCAVFGVPDPDFGEAVQAVVEMREGHPGGPATALQLADHLRAEIAATKMPRKIAFVERLPRLDSGKVRKADLKTAYSDPETRGFATRRDGKIAA
ncbi:MAG: AMP-binding protein [Pacificimonas sp.]